MRIEEVKKIAQTHGSVVSVSLWEKHGKRRAYVEFEKLNGGKKWNSGKAGTVYYDEESQKFTILRDSLAGAKTRESIKSALEEMDFPYVIR